ncbi:hypothetical protein C8N36_1334 [Pelagimonas varians]|uniref:Uncharacterized protein n=1 Tax=Pelagimonas varians TaxID=696760 RepID=A0A238L4D9_9RHOB|nr:hypothetical protein C8N36_1334 [Pelagimonas varians]SMX49848.1 hypothetical protein PEV8663_04360 [Pelagimonas varians]
MGASVVAHQALQKRVIDPAQAQDDQSLRRTTGLANNSDRCGMPIALVREPATPIVQANLPPASWK